MGRCAGARGVKNNSAHDSRDTEVSRGHKKYKGCRKHRRYSKCRGISLCMEQRDTNGVRGIQEGVGVQNVFAIPLELHQVLVLLSITMAISADYK